MCEVESSVDYLNLCSSRYSNESCACSAGGNCEVNPYFFHSLIHCINLSLCSVFLLWLEVVTFALWTLMEMAIQTTN